MTACLEKRRKERGCVVGGGVREGVTGRVRGCKGCQRGGVVGVYFDSLPEEE